MTIRRFHHGCLAALGALMIALRADAAPEADPSSVVIVYNRTDPASESLAATYAQKRGIPFDHVIGLSAPAQETITRAEYDGTIAGPLREEFIQRGWWKGSGSPLKVTDSSIRYVALIRGVPLRIAKVQEPYPGDDPTRLAGPLRPNEASVDSELAGMGLGRSQISGPLDNPYHQSVIRFGETTNPGLLLVCRLDAPTPATVQRMMSDSINAEKQGLWGFAYVDSRNLRDGAMGAGDEWFRAIAGNVMQNGIPAIHEATPKLFGNRYPMRYAAFYFGWYSEQVAGPFASEQFRFVPGAVAVHLHSFSAVTLRDPKRNWAGPLLERGAAATIGNVFEPYLSFTPDLSIFEERLRQGFTFAEAAYAAQPVLSWMTTFVGDPLYRPFAGRQAKGAPQSAQPWIAFREGARLWYNKSRGAGEAFLLQKGKTLKSGVLFEGLAGLQLAASDSDAAIRSLSFAHNAYPDEIDRVRCALRGAILLNNTGRKKAALELARRQVAATPKAAGANLLAELINQLDPPPPPPKPKAPTAPNLPTAKPR